MRSPTSTPGARGAAPCGCAGTEPASPCTCAGAGCASCQATGYVQPRFFAGQLLTEEDLQALSDYVLAKNRLHNRHFLGDGVVCGLAVTCNPCGGGKLVVQPGHALDCCGNDLVLECAVELDANAMVRDLRRSQLGADCGDPCAERKPNGEKMDQAQIEQATRRYCLYLRYSEEATDPVAPYATDEPCGAAGCEFTRMREGVRFELRCGDAVERAGGFLARVRACLADLTRIAALTAALAKLVGKEATAEDVRAARGAVLDRIDASAPQSDCRLRADVAAIAIPAQGGSVAPARNELVQAFLRLVRDCICTALLPPCAPCDDTGVLLACFEMAECEVTKVCNLERKFVLTGPNLRYWIPLDLAGVVVEELCCAVIGTGKPERKPPVARFDGAAAHAADGKPAKAGRGLDALWDLVSGQVLSSFGLDPSDVIELEHIGHNLRDIFDASGFDSLLPARAMRMPGAGAVREAVSGRVVDSDAFRAAVAEFEKQNATKLEAARAELQADYQRTATAAQQENRELRAQLEAVLQRMSKLEQGPVRPDDVVKKPRK